MNLLVSDYDGTFHYDDNDLITSINTKNIKQYMSDENLFAIATGRTYSSIKRQTNRYHIPYNYLICSNGSCIFDKDDNLVYSIKPDYENLKEIYNYLKSLPYVLKIEFIDIYGNNTINLEDASQIICFVKLNSIRKMKQTNFDGFAKYNILNTFSITNNTTKKDAIEQLKQLEHINDENIYTIGDGLNDLEMLKSYNGYRVFLSDSSLFNQDIPLSSVKRLSRKLRG